MLTCPPFGAPLPQPAEPRRWTKAELGVHRILQDARQRLRQKALISREPTTFQGGYAGPYGDAAARVESVLADLFADGQEHGAHSR